MYAQSVLAVTGALLSLVAAVPMAGEPHHKHHPAHKRDIVWKTEVDEVIVTVPVTKTVWIEPGETPPTGPDSYSAPASSSAPAVQPAAYTPSPQSSAPAYSAPAYSAPAYSAPASSAPAYSAPTESSAPAAPAYTPPSSSSAPAAAAYTAPSSSSAAAVPAYTPPTTSSAAPAYTAPASSAAPASASSSASTTGGGSGLSYGLGQSGKTYSGDLTYYAPGLGACGYTNTTDQPIIAIAEALFDSYDNGNSNNNPLCGKWVTITGKDGQSYKGQIVDRCTGCQLPDLDLSETLFNDATSNGDGRVSNMKWCFD